MSQGDVFLGHQLLFARVPAMHSGDHRFDRRRAVLRRDPMHGGYPGSEQAGLALLYQEMTGATDLQAINLSADHLLKIGFIECEEGVGPRT